MKNLALTICFVAAALTAQGQTDTTRIAQIDQMATLKGMQTNSLSSVVQTFDFRYEGIRGSRFLSDQYATGELWLTNNRHYNQKDLLYKFDESENAVQIRYPTGKEILIDAKEVLRFRLDLGVTPVFYFTAPVPNGNMEELKLFQVLYLGNKVNLVKLPMKKLIRVDRTGAYTTNERYDEFVDKSRYFVKLGDKSFIEIERPTRKGLLAAMPTKKAKLKYLFDEVPKFANTREYNDVLLAEIAAQVDIRKGEKEEGEEK
jgi:hypothetical protein